MANANSNGNEEAAVAIAGAPQKITESLSMSSPLSWNFMVDFFDAK